MTRFDTFLLGCIFGAALMLALVFGAVKAMDEPVRDLNTRMASEARYYPYGRDYIFSPVTGERIP